MAANDVEVGLDLALAALREVTGECSGPQDAGRSGNGRAHETGEGGERMAAEPDQCAYAVGRLADWRADDRSAWINVGHAIKAAFASDKNGAFSSMTNSRAGACKNTMKMTLVSAGAVFAEQHRHRVDLPVGRRRCAWLA